MTMSQYSRESLLGFLKQSGMAGLMNPATARSRRTAAEQLLGGLSGDEAADLRELDVDELCGRFHKLQGTSIRPEALKLYNSRLKAALGDFFAWTENPETFVASGPESQTLRRRADRTSQRSIEEQALEAIRLTAPQRPADILPIPIRPDHVIFVQNLPLDLSPAEANKVTRVIQALACAEHTGSEEDGE